MGNKKKKKKKKSCREQVSEIFFFFFSFFPPSKKSPGPPPFLPNDTDQKKAESMAQNVLVMGKKKRNLFPLSLSLSLDRSKLVIRVSLVSSTLVKISENSKKLPPPY